jgi:hypothetical protein
MSANIVLRQTAEQITINRSNPDILLVGVAGPVGPGGAGGILGYYGAFSSYVNQTAASTTVGYPMAFEQTDEANGVSMTTGTGGTKSRITFSAAGTYNIQFSAQFENTDNSAHDIQIWLRKNEIDVTGSTGFVSVPAKHAGDNGHSITGWNFVFTAAANDYYEFYWQTDNTGVSIHTYAGGTTPTTPSTASLVLTVTQVMNTQLGPTGPAGTITISSTTTGAPGTSALVSNTGTATAAVLNFTIPRGDTGSSGDWATLQTINTQTNSYTLLSSDVGKLVSLNSSGALSLTLNTGTVIGTGARIDLLQFGAGQVTVGGTATINATPTLKLRTQYSAATLICVASNSYVLVGDLAVS